MEPQVTVQIAAEVLGGGVVHPLRQANHLDLLRDHIDDKVGRQARAAVIEPLEDIAVAQRGDPNGASLVVDLGVVIGYLELADHIGQLAQLAVAQLFGGVPIQHGDLVKGDLLDLIGKAAGLYRHQLGIGAAAQNDAGKQAAHHIDDEYGADDHQRNHAAALQQLPEGPAVFRLPVNTGGDGGGDAVNGGDKEEEAVKCRRVKIDGGQLHIEVDKARYDGNDEVNEDVFAGKAGFGHRWRSFRIKSDQWVRSSPQKNSATVPGPVWLPMVVPMLLIITLPLRWGNFSSTRSATARASSIQADMEIKHLPL